MDDIDALLLLRVGKPSGIVPGELPVWNGSTWVRSSTVMPVGLTSAYSSYTPTLTAGGGAPTLGNGTVFAHYLQIGKFVHAYGHIVLGTTTSFGTGILNIALPVTALASISVLDPIGFGRATNGNEFPLRYYLSSTTVVQANTTTTYGGAATQVSGGSAVPFGWTTGTAIDWNLIYEAA